MSNQKTMELGREMFSLYHYLHQNGFFKEINSVLELGEPTTNKKISPTKFVYQWLGIKEPTLNPLDLNKDLSKDYNQTFDLVTNYGATENVFNQYNCFKNIHGLTKTGGYMLHALPFQGSIGNRFYNYQPNFYLDLAIANKYDVVGMWLVAPDFVLPYSKEKAKKLLKQGLNNLTIYCFFRKTSSDSFKIPFQGKYVEVTQVQMAKNLKSPQKPLLRRFLSKIMKMKV